LWDEISNHDLSKENRRLEIPVYIFHGIYDYTCSYELSREYFKNIEAPVKKFFTFYESAHSPIFEEPAKSIEIIRNEILNEEQFSRAPSS
jgi:pimeloyl-ACP methyl ester carboxylesterase